VVGEFFQKIHQPRPPVEGKGYGKGRKEIMANPYVGASRIYIEIWCDLATADSIVEYCNRKDFENHGVTAGKEPLLVHGQEASKFSKKV